jgi:hypothetical protein
MQRFAFGMEHKSTSWWCVLRGVREAPFIVLIGRFSGEIRAGTLITAF